MRKMQEGVKDFCFNKNVNLFWTILYLILRIRYIESLLYNKIQDVSGKRKHKISLVDQKIRNIRKIL
jgi:hypothetical protein